MGNPRRSAEPTTRASRPRGQARVGTLIVGDHVGAPAASAAQSVRRAGLRPGLDRSFGHPTEETGRVVAQEPPAGSEAPRNAMVTLYVAAPGPQTPASDEPHLDTTADAARAGVGERDLRPAEEQPSDAAGEPSTHEEPTEEHPIGLTGGDEPPSHPTAGWASDRDEIECAADARSGYELEDAVGDHVPDPFREPAVTQPLAGRVYPRTPTRWKVRRLGGQLRAHRGRVLVSVLLLGVLVAHGFGGSPRPAVTSTAAGSAERPLTAARRPPPKVRAKDRVAPRHSAEVVRRARRHRPAAAATSAGAPRPALSPPVGVPSGAEPAPVPQASGGPFSP
jgi:PASTA domain